jgi:hypothetical protein
MIIKIRVTCRAKPRASTPSYFGLEGLFFIIFGPRVTAIPAKFCKHFGPPFKLQYLSGYELGYMVDLPNLKLTLMHFWGRSDSLRLVLGLNTIETSRPMPNTLVTAAPPHRLFVRNTMDPGGATLSNIRHTRNRRTREAPLHTCRRYLKSLSHRLS